MSLKKNWKPVIEKFQSKLSVWKANTLSFGGRLTLIKSVLGSLPTYYLSLFKAPTGILNSLEKIRRRFLWGGNEEKRKIHWVEWSKIVADKKDGGLGVGSLLAQNTALLVKWWWRLINEHGSLWARVIVSIHNLHKQPAHYLARNDASGVWGNIYKSIKGLNKFNIDPNSLFSLIPGSNSKILFWKDVWCGNTTLQSRFPGLYELESVKRCFLMDRFCSSGFNWKWKNRRFNAMSLVEINDFYSLFCSITLSHPPKNGFHFNLHTDGTYLVRILRRLVDSKTPHSISPPICWSKFIPQKVKCFVWRAALDRIPITENLVRSV